MLHLEISEALKLYTDVANMDAIAKLYLDGLVEALVKFSENHPSITLIIYEYNEYGVPDVIDMYKSTRNDMLELYQLLSKLTDNIEFEDDAFMTCIADANFIEKNLMSNTFVLTNGKGFILNEKKLKGVWKWLN